MYRVNAELRLDLNCLMKALPLTTVGLQFHAVVSYQSSQGHSGIRGIGRERLCEEDPE